MSRSRRRYGVGSLARGRQVLASFGDRFPGARERPRPLTRTYYDTFDWRLHSDGGTLEVIEEDGDTWLRWRTFDGATRRRLRVTSIPRFASDLPRGAAREALARVISVRRLLPVVVVESRVESHRVLNENGKTLVKLELTTGRAHDPGPTSGGGRMSPVLEVAALKGYEPAFRQAVAYLERQAGGLEPVPDCELDRALSALGRRARDYSSKLEYQLQPDMPAGAALREILRGLLAVIEANEDGVRRGLDSEFLHDFRVAVRRTRSALSQLPGVLPAQAAVRFRRDFSWLGGVTGPTRDLDVYLLKLPAYGAGLPPETHRDLEPLQLFLRRQQRREHRRLVRSLDSKRFRRLVIDWRGFLSDPAGSADEAPEAATPIVDLASRRIWKRYRRVMKDGLAIGPETGAATVHRLRIDCKKLRYLLEFFRGLYDDHEIGPLIGELKRLQDNLGDFNDYQVQQEALAEYGRQMAEEGLGRPETLLAMGRMLDRLALDQAAERRRVAKRFARFASRPNRQRFRLLFKSSRRRPS